LAGNDLQPGDDSSSSLSISEASSSGGGGGGECPVFLILKPPRAAFFGPVLASGFAAIFSIKIILFQIQITSPNNTQITSPNNNTKTYKPDFSGFEAGSDWILVQI
jgi:hypothetical protein